MTADVGPLPNFLIIGAAKAGTTFLAARIANHPEAFVVQAPKEANYFSYEYQRGPSWYRSLFRDAGDAKAIGESSPSYTERTTATASSRIAELLPEARLIYMVRHPLRRIESHWAEDLQSGFYEQRPFAEAVRQHSHLVDSSLYMAHLGRFRDRFPDDQILVLFQEDLQADPAGSFRRCFAFLGIDPEFSVPASDQRLNVRADLRRATPALKLARSVGRRVLGPATTSRLPRSLKIRVNRLLGSNIPRPVIDAELRRWLIDRVADDAARFLDHCGRPRDFWKLDGDG